MELISFIQVNGKFHGGDLIIKTDSQSAALLGININKNTVSSKDTKSPKNSQDAACKPSNNSEDRKVKLDLTKIHNALNQKQEADLELTNGWIVF